MAVIFALSAQSDLDTGAGVIGLIVRKLGHMFVYGLLWFLWWRAFGGRHAVAAAAITILYAVTDELHQATVAGRHGAVTDVLIDAAGVAAAMLAVHWIRRRRASGGTGSPGRGGADEVPAEAGREREDRPEAVPAR
jgi:VanZ family protein